MQICNSIFLAPFLTQFVIFIVVNVLGILWKNISKSEDEKINPVTPTTFLCLGIAIINRLYFSFTSSSYLYSIVTFNDISSSIPAQGWFVDFIIVLVLLLLIDNLYQDGSINPYFQHVFVMILDPTIAMIFHIMGFNDSTHLQNTKYSLFVFSTSILLELYLWIPLVLKWMSNHCFLDGFMVMNNPANIYVTISILLADIILVAVFTKHVKNLWMKILLITLAFYNTAICLSIYGIYITILKIKETKKENI